MNTYIAKWPDGSMSILNAIDKVHLFDKLDREGNPYSCQLFEAKSEMGDFHFNFKIAEQGDERFVDIEEFGEETTIKKTKLPKDSFIKHMSRVMNKSEKEIRAIPNLLEIKKQMGIDQ
jgi:hypothetical protein